MAKVKSGKNEFVVFIDDEFADIVDSIQEGLEYAKEEVSSGFADSVEVKIYQLVKSGKFELSFVE